MGDKGGTQRYDINRYIVECKDEYPKIKNFRAYILIDTQWNVKTIQEVLDYLGYDILIDTQWNVKNGDYPQEIQSASDINRYIVECKVWCGHC